MEPGLRQGIKEARIRRDNEKAELETKRILSYIQVDPNEEEEKLQAKEDLLSDPEKT